MPTKEKVRISIKLISLIFLSFLILYLIRFNIKSFKVGDSYTELDSTKKTTTKTKDLSNITAFLEFLKQQGYRVDAGSVTSDNTLSVPALKVAVNDEELLLYEYNSSKEAKKDASEVLGSFSDLTKENPERIHFFRQNDLVVFYEGDNSEILRTLEKAFGPQFAGE